MILPKHSTRTCRIGASGDIEKLEKSALFLNIKIFSKIIG